MYVPVQSNDKRKQSLKLVWQNCNMACSKSYKNTPSTLNQYVPIVTLYMSTLETLELRWPRDRYELNVKSTVTHNFVSDVKEIIEQIQVENLGQKLLG